MNKLLAATFASLALSSHAVMQKSVAQAPAQQAAPAQSKAPLRPNIIYVLADDLGWNDVGFHGSEIQTPNLDRLMKSGVNLNQFYVQPVCSPTRAALLTGRYPLHTGITKVIFPYEDGALPVNERLMSQALREAGYETAITGKWHLGAAKRAYLPTQRGFDHQYGHYSGLTDYYKHQRSGGYDWHRDDKVNYDKGYSTDLIGQEAEKRIIERDKTKPLFLYVAFNAPHTPLQAPPEELAKYPNIQNKKRRTFAAMVTRMDTAIGRIADTLDRAGISDNTLLIFSSDNGGHLAAAGRNAPLRGEKAQSYEGGVRAPAFAVWKGHLKAGTTVDEPIGIVDWYPTFLKLGGASATQPLPIDGQNIWPVLSQTGALPERDLVIDLQPNSGALRHGPWKLVEGGAKGKKDTIELFNLAQDPNEATDLAAQQPDMAQQMKTRLDAWRKDAIFYKSIPEPANFQGPAIYGENE